MLRLRVFLLAVIALFFTVQASFARTPFTYADVSELEGADNQQISPNGDHLVYVRKGMDRMKGHRRRAL
ncbi:MAG: hypothetical protein AAGG50_07120 [Bacteroidota bacterium]